MIDTSIALNSIFQITGFLTAILFSVYCFCIVSSNEFIVKIRGTKTFLSSKNYIKFTFSLGLFICISSILAVSVIYPDGAQDIIFYIVASLTIWWLFRFIKCYKMFDTLSNT